MGSVSLNSEHFDKAAYALKGAMESFSQPASSLDESVRRFEQSVQTLQIQVDRMAKIAGMVGRNQMDQNMNQPPSYLESDFGGV